MHGEIYATATITNTARLVPSGKIILRPAALAKPDASGAVPQLSQMLVELDGKNYSIQWDPRTIPVDGEQR